ncbi:phosphoribosylanthranilate isomerase [Catalinimonas niigatensis]|uniref:phosphoribosylanthranilate isomerase n=1 Tax=Catalinimonas niigatensis TaxID=1397264 RepID=UPI0026665128|nr:phosphoribosylanthranilate isomerase [Catalinimonas niigatensis]WPP52956.1 phosphoribosylanthranilate isomerase [Catalinimonas niigatensis]
MKFSHNMHKVARMKPDYLGFIFYEKSRRYMADTLHPKDLQELPRQIRKVGVFVDATTQEMLKQAKKYQLDLLQLHGQESAEQCEEIKKAGFKVIKVFSIGQQDFDFAQLDAYKPHVSYFLFDTAGEHPGGNGETFDWGQLRRYDQEVPFFLSGGISLDNVPQLRELSFFNIHAIDVNSRFEIEPGLKDVNLVQKLKDKLYGRDERKPERLPFSLRRKKQ